ncbi:MAG: nucleotidyltransferase family protein [Anaerolineaceae bacterium]|nr:nucleotidyltransferase family protein [Anaerolineaceae bacterium]
MIISDTTPIHYRNYINIGRWILLQERFKEVSLLLLSNEIQFVPLKGLYFNSLVYPENNPRPLNDIDIVIKREQYISTCKLLLENGFRLEPQLGYFERALEIPVDHWPTGLSFTKPGSGFYLDLQWHFVEHWFIPAFNIDFESIWNRVEPANEKAKPLWKWQLSIQDTLAHLCLHCSKDGMYNLKTYRDLDLYIRQLPQSWNWDLFLDLVNQWQITTIAWQVFQILDHFHKTPFPKEIISELSPSPLRQRLLNELVPVSEVFSTNPNFGKRYSKILKLVQIQKPLKIFTIISKVIFPGNDWIIGRYGKKVSIIYHWSHIAKRFFDKNNK